MLQAEKKRALHKNDNTKRIEWWRIVSLYCNTVQGQAD